MWVGGWVWYWGPQRSHTFDRCLSDDISSRGVRALASAPGNSACLGDAVWDVCGAVRGCGVLGPVLFTKWVEIKPLSDLYSLDISLDFCQLSS